MTQLLSHLPLRGTRVLLEPMTLAHVDAVAAAAARVGPEGNLTSVPVGADPAERYVRFALAERASGRALPFVICDTAQAAGDAQVVGSTRLANLEYWEPENALPQVAEIGWTWLAREARRTAINTECKLLLLRHAFEVLQVARVTIKTDARNERSRNAILRIGGSFEGILRNHMRAYDGPLRDTAMFSVIAAEWPAVRDRLEMLLAPHSPGAPSGV